MPKKQADRTRQPDDVLLAFGEEVRRRRTKAGMSQERLGFLAELDRTYVSSLERGRRNVSLRNIYRLAKALGCRARDLLL